MFTQNIVVNEICTKNKNIIVDADYVQFVDWVELKNNTSSHLNITGYFLSDDSTNKTKWQFPNTTILFADSFLVVWADGRNTTEIEHHLSFKLSSNEGVVALYDSDTTLVDMISYDEQFTDIAFGKSENGYAYFGLPTPRNENTSEPFYNSERENKPVFSLSSGMYPSGSILSISGEGNNSEIRFTIDGSYPLQSSTLYEEPVILTENNVVRARIYGNLLPGKITSGSYFISIDKSLPLVSLIISPDFLWSDELGIFNDNEIEKRVEWERSSTIEYFPDNSLGFDVENEIRLFGTTAYELPQKSFAVFANNDIDYHIFPNKELDIFDSFILRSSSDDWHSTMFRDGFVQSMISERLDIDYQAYQPTVLYINGEYFGIFNLREKYNEDYLKNNHGIDKDSIDLLGFNFWESQIYVFAGSNETYLELLDYLNSHDMSDNEQFTGVYDFLDVENYTKYISSQIYIGNRSYKHNIKAWRENNILDGFKWLIYDLDRSYLDSWREIFQQIYDADPIFHKLLENENYRNHYLQQSCSHINATYRKSYADFIIDSIQNMISDEMPYHIEKWQAVGGIQSIEAWNSKIQEMKDFSVERKDTLLIRLNEFYNLDGTVELTLTKSPPQGGNVYIEGINIPYSDSSHTYFKNVPTQLVARANLGYTFIDWQNISVNDSLEYIFTNDLALNARFEANCSVPDTVTEDAIFLRDCSPYYINHDIVVKDGYTLYCQPGVELFFGEGTKLIVEGNLSFVGEKENLITIKGQSNQVWKYIQLQDGKIHLKHVVCYSGEKAISFSGDSEILIENCTFYESDFDELDLISGSSASVTFIENTFYGNESNSKKDCIDCDGIASGYFANNTFWDVSDDCIDIGTQSGEVEIFNNEFYNCQSMAVSIGEESTAIIHRNIMANGNGAIQVHTGAEASIINNTFYNNEVGIRCYHYDNQPESGGTANIINTIFSNCGDDYTLISNSEINISYSLSDNILFNGEGNIQDNPRFLNPEESDFNIMEDSPCIDTGDPSIIHDPDGTRVDIGALFFNQDSSVFDYEQSLFIYPNPFTDYIVINLNNETIQEIEGYNLLGKRIFSKPGNSEKSQYIKIHHKGLLLLIVTDDNGNRHTAKLISK